MLGAKFQLTRGRHGEDPFYSSAKARRANQRTDQLQRAQSDVSSARSAYPKENFLGSMNRECQNESALQKVIPNLATEPSASSSSNLECFLEHSNIDTHALRSSLKTRRPGDGSDSEFRDSSGDVSTDSESERVTARVEHISLRDQHQEDSSSDDGKPLSSLGRVIFEYLERDLPYIREPLADKVSDLAARFPELKTLRSCDLLPSSWFSVAWYPIYKIPTGPTVKDLDACFLTYHSLNTPLAGPDSAQPMSLVQPRETEKMSLPVFGLASYKFRGSVWTHDGGSEHQLVNSLFQAADKWLRSCHVNHPDFLFFCRR